MNDGKNTNPIPLNKNPLPRVVKGTGFYTPMDIAPGESPSATSQSEVVSEMVGLSTPMDIAPTSSPQTPSDTGSSSSSENTNESQRS